MPNRFLQYAFQCRKPMKSYIRQALASTKGFTLLEILIVIALLGVVSMPLGAALTMGLKTFQSESFNVALEQDQRAAVTWIETLCRTYPDEVLINESTKTLTVHGHSFAIDSSQALVETTMSTDRTLCTPVSRFEFSDITRNTNQKILGFTIKLKTQTPTNAHELITTITLDRY